MTTKLGPQHEQGGGAVTAPWLQYCKSFGATGDLGISTLAPPGVLALGRVVDDGLIDGQGFDSNRYYLMGVAPGYMAFRYMTDVWGDKVVLNPGLKVLEGPIEQIITDENVMQWYGEFCYQYAKLVYELGQSLRRPLIAGIGSWSTGNPPSELYLWPHWTKALDATRSFGAIYTRHSYGNLNEHDALRHRWDLRIFATLGYPGVTAILTECGAGSGIATYNYDIERYWNEWLLPFQREIDRDPQLIGAHLFSVGGTWQEFNVAPYPAIIDKISSYVSEVPPSPEPPPPPIFPFRVKVRNFAWNLRDAPANRIVTYVLGGKTFNVVNKVGEWYQAELWIHQSGVDRI